MRIPRRLLCAAALGIIGWEAAALYARDPAAPPSSPVWFSAIEPEEEAAAAPPLRPRPPAAPDAFEQVHFQEDTPLAPADPLRPASPTPPATTSPLAPNRGLATDPGTRRAPRFTQMARRNSPMMIGDFFGGANSSILVPAQTRSFADFIRDSNNQPLIFSGEEQTDSSFLLIPSQEPIVLMGDVPATIPTGTTWQSLGPVISQAAFPLQENAAETAATKAAFPDSADVIFNGGTATQAGTGPSTIYNLFTDYTIVDSPEIAITIPSPGSGGAVVGRQKIAENSSPMPRDRVFLNYSHFNNVPLTASGVNVDRMVPGFEKTFFDGQTSFEVRIPTAITLDSNFYTGGGTSTDSGEIGNLTMAVKGLVYTDDTLAVSVGTAWTLPTADDTSVFLPDFTRIVQVDNEAVHLLPFIGALYTPSERFYTQGFLQLDIDTDGNPVQADTGNGLQFAGRLQDATFLFADVGAGYWIYLNDDPSNLLNGISPSMELHYNRTLDDTDSVTAGPIQIGTIDRNIEVLNAVVGTTFLFNNQATATLGFAVPLAGGADEQFDGEFRLLVNFRGGPGNRRTRAF